MFLVTERDQQTVCNKLNVLAHEYRIHANECDWERLRQELLLNLHGLHNDPLDRVRMRAPAQVAEEQAREISMHAFVTANELIAERKPRDFST